MRGRFNLLLIGLSLGTATAAPAQAVVGGFVGGPPSPRVQASDVVARLMFFDRNHDGKVERAELAERMSETVTRGDADGDGALNANEIRALTTSPASKPLFVAGQFSGSYMFADEIGQSSSRLRIEGAIDDLRLPAATRTKALARAGTFVDTLEASAAADLLNALEPLLTRDQLAEFTKALAGRIEEGRASPAANGAPGRWTLMFRRFGTSPIEQFALAPADRTRALVAMAKYEARIRLGDAERRELARQMKGILSDEDRDNLRAAVGRRPVVSTAARTPPVPRNFVTPEVDVPSFRVLPLVLRDLSQVATD